MKEEQEQEQDTTSLDIPTLDISDLDTIAEQRANIVKSIQNSLSIQDNTLDEVPILEKLNSSNINIANTTESNTPTSNTIEQSSPKQNTSTTDTKKKITVDTSALNN